MRKTILAASLATAAFALPNLAAAQAAAPPRPRAAPPTTPSPATSGLFSEYRFRGISQTYGKPAHAGRLRLLPSQRLLRRQLELQRQRGRRLPGRQPGDGLLRRLEEDLGRLGHRRRRDLLLLPRHPRELLQRCSARSTTSPARSPTATCTTSRATSAAAGSSSRSSTRARSRDYFQAPNTDGSGYIDLSANYDLGDGWGIQGHVGHLNFKNMSKRSTTPTGSSA